MFTNLHHTLPARISSLPVGLFGSTVAIAGLANAFQQGRSLFGIPAAWETATTASCWLLFITLSICYTAKGLRYPRIVKAELTHPVTTHFAGTFFISAVVLAGLTAGISMTLARIVWLTATTGGFIFLYVLTSRLYKGRLAVPDAVPPILIPGLTALNAATSGAAMQFGVYGYQANGFLFSAGIIYTLTFFVLITYRLLHFGPVPGALKPSLLLLCAPFEIGFQSYVSLVRRVDGFASVIFCFGLFIFIVLFFHVFNKALSFGLSWWGACFSTGALANAALRYATVSHDRIITIIAGVLLVLLTALIGLTSYYSVLQLFSPRQDPLAVAD
jgi:tellurite resistance protein